MSNLTPAQTFEKIKKITACANEQLEAYTILLWCSGAADKLVSLGVLGVSSPESKSFMTEKGNEIWDNIDSNRLEMINPSALGAGLAGFVTGITKSSQQQGINEFRHELAMTLALYFVESGRNQIVRLALENLALK